MVIEPETASCETWIPFTYRRSVAPSYVLARWVQVPVGSALVAASVLFEPPIVASLSGRPFPVLE